MDICQIPTKGHVSRQSHELSCSRAIELTSDLAPAPAIDFHASIEVHVHCAMCNCACTMRMRAVRAVTSSFILKDHQSLPPQIKPTEWNQCNELNVFCDRPKTTSESSKIS